jgi:hypothetical protein
MQYPQVVFVLSPASKNRFHPAFLEMMQYVLAILAFGSSDLLLESLLCFLVRPLDLFAPSIDPYQSSSLPFVEIVAYVPLQESKDEHLYMAILGRIDLCFLSRPLDMVEALHSHALLQNVDDTEQKCLLLPHCHSPRFKDHPLATHTNKVEISPRQRVNRSRNLGIDDLCLALRPNHF